MINDFFKIENVSFAAGGKSKVNNVNIKNKLDKLIKEREKFYEKANLIIENKNKISDTINELKKNLKFKIYD